jgi:hypothetical protein
VHEPGGVALKIASPDSAHKTDVCGVKPGVNGPAAAAEAFESIIASVKQQAARERIEGVLWRRNPGARWTHGLVIESAGRAMKGLPRAAAQIIKTDLAMMVR